MIRRQRAVEKRIKDITLEDSRVSFVGEVIERSQNRLVVGDDESEIEVVYEGIDVPGSKIVRVVGFVSRPLHVSAEVIQGIPSMNLDLYRRARKLFK